MVSPPYSIPNHMESEISGSCATEICGDSRKLEYLRNNFHVTLFIKEAGYRLKLAEVAIASACILYHKFNSKIEDYQNYEFDLNVVACTSLYLASKAEETPCRLRDVINVCFRTLNKDKIPIQITKKYWSLQESIVKCELLFLRVLGFQVTVENPHKYLLHYLKSLEDWSDTKAWSLAELPQFCWSTLNDTFHTTLCVEESPSRIAAAVISFGLSCTGLEIPSNQTAQRKWWQIFCPDTSEEELYKIVNTILDLYDFERNKTKI